MKYATRAQYAEYAEYAEKVKYVKYAKYELMSSTWYQVINTVQKREGLFDAGKGKEPEHMVNA